MPQALALDWDATGLERRLGALVPGLLVEVAPNLPSTNTCLLDRARGGGPFTPCLLVAEEQTRGRGRLGRDWWSSAGTSLAFSMALALRPADWAGLSLAVGLALAEALDPLHAVTSEPRIGLKWPNDLWLVDGPGRGRKLGGILIETVNAGDDRVCVVGVGLNVLTRSATGPRPPLAHGYAALQEIDPAASAPVVLAQLALPLLGELLRFESEGFAPRVGDYARRDLLAGRPVSTTLPGLACGVAQGVDERGALCVRQGGLHRVVSGEVSVRLREEMAAADGGGQS